MSKVPDNFFKWSIIGHRQIVSYLQNNLKNSQTAHAYLFCGPSHIGKSTVAKEFLASLVCRNLHQKQSSVPCGQCDCCKQINSQIHPDVYWLKREINEKTGKKKKNISIEQVRELQNKLSLHSFLDTYKIAVIADAQTLSQEAANSLLKTLEEPSPKTIIILLATNSAELPATIISRCQLIKFYPVDPKDIFDHLIDLKVERKKAKTLTALSFGRPGVALNYFLAPEKYEAFEEQIQEFVSLIKSGNIERFKMISEIIESHDADELKEILAVWTKVIRDLLLLRIGAQDFISNLNLFSELEQVAKVYQSKDLIENLKKINQAKRYLSANVNPKLALENLVLNF
ncbi:MAG: DNA polymerase III subunit delta' [Candidatus Buchananbacteria bacterium]